MNNLPSWTITRYEVDRDAKIGLGFFSDVYKGTWRSKAVAIKGACPPPPPTFIKVIFYKRALTDQSHLPSSSSPC